MKISVVIPVYKSQETIQLLTQKLIDELSKITNDYEIIYVNDDSPDNSWDIIQKLCKENPKIIGISLSRNFGQHPAILCGIKHSRGDAIIVMDCDLQEDPKYIPDLVKKLQEGNDIVFTLKQKRAHAWWKNVMTKIFSFIYNYLIDDKRLLTSQQVGSFSIINRKVADAFLQFGDYQFHYLLVLRWLGFKQSFIEIEHYERKAGKSSYNFKRLFEHALVAIVFQSDKLLRFNIYIGFIISFFSIIGIIYLLISYFIHGYAKGWPSLFMLLLFTLGAVLFSLGIIGLYIGKMFEQVKSRPKFVIKELLNLEK
ncbi:dolichol-phosphate mannosyltransferase [Thermonema lapsum]|uniref:Dolichol-phosphate mannosyltransferase n=1 Tax=Thermonema lapsum TaxID=28195 RepID=A0A846MPW7_9BACT|nr:glycosyltransferase family 2 protein [Thermonema lapsum]NIK73604.1 dolichol-phosphate mannosyltransferase [Thermonema lapsum]